MRYRAAALVLSAVSILFLPVLFASDHDKDKKSKDTSSSSPQQPQPQPKPAPQPRTPPPQTNTHYSPPPPPQTSTHYSPPPPPPRTTQQTNAQPAPHPEFHVVTHANEASSSQKTDKSHHTPYGGQIHTTQGFRDPAPPAGTSQVKGSYVPPPIRRVPGNNAPVTDHASFSKHMNVHPTAAIRAQAYEQDRHERTLFVRPAPPRRIVKTDVNLLVRMKIVPTTYHYRRTVFYDAYAWEPPDYVYNFYPSYGVWDATFLAFALDHIAEEQYALLFYNHRNDAEVQQWMEDAQKLAADNEELRAKLAALDGQVAKFQEAGVESDPTYIPPDAQDVALSPELIEKMAAASAGGQGQ